MCSLGRALQVNRSALSMCLRGAGRPFMPWPWCGGGWDLARIDRGALAWAKGALRYAGSQRRLSMWCSGD